MQTANQLKCGISRVDITPINLKKSVFLAGFEARRNSGDINVLDPLYIKVAWIRSNGKDLIIINGDLLYFSEQTCSDIWKWVEQNYYVDAKYVILSGTHTHSSFHPGGPFFDGSIQSYQHQQSISDFIKKAVKEAFGDLTSSKILVAKTKCSIGVNRRKAIIRAADLKIFSFRRSFANRPNPKGPVDKDLYIIRIIRERKSDCFLLNYACHPSVLRGRFISADFPGRLEPMLKESYGVDVSVLYLQGFAGNVRPNILAHFSSAVKSPKDFLIQCIEGRNFEKNTTEKDVDEIAARIVYCIKKVPDKKYEEISFLPFSKELKIRFPFKSIPSKEFFMRFHSGTEKERGWVKYVIENYDSFKNKFFKIRRVDLNKKYSFLCIPAEVFCEYSIVAKKVILNRKIIPLGYSNGMLGYLPTARAVSEGGYEVDRAYKIYGLPCPFSEDIEREVLDGLKILYEDRAEIK